MRDSIFDRDRRSHCRAERSKGYQGPYNVRYADDDTDSDPRLGDLIEEKQKKSESAIKEIGEIQLWNFRLALNEIAE
jgi:hypothetical protein